MRRSRLALAVAVALASIAALGTAAHATNDTLYGGQWNLGTIGAQSAWDRGGTGSGVTIGIVDTGVDLQQEDLAGHVIASADCTNTAGNAASCHGTAQAGASPDLGHGTHVAGIAVATANNGRGIAGIAPDAKIVVAKVLSYNGQGQATGSLDDVGAGIRWVVQHGARVVNLSLGVDDSNVGGKVATLSGTTLNAYINEAWNNGAIPVVAAGNNGASSPSNYQNVNAIVVTATTQDDRQAAYASQTSGTLSQARYAMAAPGGEMPADKQCPGVTPNGSIVSTFWDGNTQQHDEYACYAGTSMAAPHVSAAAAILLGLGLTKDQTVNRLLSTAKNIGPSTTFGSGRLDLAAATAGLGHPVATTSPPSTPATTRAARIRSSAPATTRATTRVTAATAPSTTTATEPPTTTTTTEPPTTSTTSNGKVVALGAHGNGPSNTRRVATVLAIAGVATMGASSGAALRRRRLPHRR